ncbi:uncharacterized protein [Salminus brasiliensis]|uniref:uncharacterized protein isoform X2 n=1 Tax=Salminus brasiliensis TaxID=930266 RepID=UPI003B82CFDE
MCDCFHLAFPNWHGPATGAGRRLKGPEQDTEDDSVCEEPEILEGERPRPQGSSPVEEFPAEKTDIQSGEAGVIVKTVKEACADGLVVTGGGKEGIFIKEVKPDSPASKHLTVKEGDQILSATVYFDNVSYEDALQILEHAQPYKMEFCLRRKKESTMPGDAESIQPDITTGNERGSPQMRSPRKKKQQDRISWPKFPSLSKGHKAQFKRSHSTSEAEEHKKLEMSPPTSDTDSPLKSPLKSPDGKAKKKKQKIKLKMKMKGHRSKSVEETQRSENKMISENLIILEDHQVGDTLEDQFHEQPVTKLEEIPQDMDESEYMGSFKIANDQAFPSLSGMEGQHEVHLISLGNTLKTTDISDALAEGFASDVRLSDEGKTERSELKISIHHQEEKSKTALDGQLTNVSEMSRTLDPSAYDNVVISQADVETSQLDTNINTEIISKESPEKNLKLKSGNTEMDTLKLDASVDVLNVGELKQSPRTDSEKQWKEKTIFENEIYGIRTRGPLADMATSKTPFASAVNGLQFIMSDSSEMGKDSNMPESITVISQPLPKAPSTFSAGDVTDSHLKIKPSKFKLPRVDHSGFAIEDPMTKVELSKRDLPKREDLEIPGMEDTKTKPSLQTPRIKVPKTEKIINITKEREIQARRTEEFSVEDVKEAVSKFPALKLPEGDITGVLVQREVTIMEMKSDKTSMTPRGSPRKISSSSADSSTTITKIKLGKEESLPSNLIDKDTVIKMPKVDLPYADEETITVSKIDYTKPKSKTQQTKTDEITDDEKIPDVKFKLPKREDLEIPGMEAIKESSLPSAKITLQSDIKMSERHESKKYSSQKEQEKKSKKQKKSTPTFGMTKPDIRLPDIGIELSKKDVQSKKEPEKIKKTGLGGDSLHDDIKLPENTQLNRMETTSPMSESKIKQKEVDLLICEQIGEIVHHKPTEDIRKQMDNKTETSDIKTDVKGRKFKLPKFDISFPEVKAPKMHVSASKKEVDPLRAETKKEDQAMSEVKAVLHPSPVEDLTKTKIPDTEFKLSVKPVKSESEKRELDTQLKIPVESQSVEIKLSDVDKEEKYLKAQDIQTEEQGSRFRLPKFEIRLPDIKGPKIDLSAAKTELEISLPERKVEVHPHEDDVQDVKELDTKAFEVKSKQTSFSFPRFGFSKAEASDTNLRLPNDNVSLSEGHVDLEGANTNIAVSRGDTDQKDEPKFGSPTKFKLPSITLPKFGSKTSKAEKDISTMDLKAKGPEIFLTDAELKLSTAPEMKGLDLEQEVKYFNVDHGMQVEGKKSTFKLPKSDVTFPKVEGPQIDSTAARQKTEMDISLPEVKMEVHPFDVAVPEIDSKGLDEKTKQPSFQFPKFGFSKSEVKVPEADASLPEVDVKLPEGSVDLEGPKIDISVSTGDSGQKEKTKFGSPTKFKLPSITLPQFTIKAPKGELEDVHITGPEISLPNAELELSAEAPSADVKMPDFDKQEKSLRVDMKAKDIHIEGQGSKFKLPTFGISLPEVKGPKIDSSAAKPEIDISLPEGKIEVQPPDVDLKGGKTLVEADIPEIDSEGLDVKMKRPSFSLPKFGFSKSEVKVPEADASLPEVDVKLPEGSVDLEGPKIDISVSTGDSGQKEKTKFKLPSITLPQFTTKAPKGEVEDVHITGPEISLPNAELELSAEALSADVKMPDFDKQEKSLSVDMKAKDIHIEGQGSKFKLPTFGINLPEVKGPKIDSSAAKPEIDINLPEGKMEVQPPDLELKEGTTKVKADIPEIDSKGLDVKMKRPGFSFPKFGFSKSEVKVPEADASLPEVDVKLPEGSVDVEVQHIDLSASVSDSGQKEKTKFGSPTKFKLPSITLPQFTIKAPKGEVEDVHITGPEISLPNAELELSVEAPSADLKMPDFDKQEKSLSVDMKAKDIHIEGQGSKFKLPTFGISLPEVKGPKTDSIAAKPEIDINLPEGKMEVQPPNLELKEGTTKVKADIPEIDSKGLDVKMKRPGFSFPKFGFSKSEVKVPEADASLPEVDVKLPEGSVDVEVQHIDLSASVSDSGQKEKTKFGSPTKFKLPSITLPQFTIKAPKGEAEDVHITGPEISLPNAELELSVEAPSADVKMPDFDKQEKSLGVDMKAKDIHIEGQGSKFKLPTFGISLPEVKGPKIDSSAAKPEIDISLPEGKMEVQPPDLELKEGTTKVKADIPEIDSKGLDVKMKRPSFSFPKFGFSKSEVKVPEADASLPEVDVKLPEGRVDLEGPKIDISVSTGDSGQKEKTKFGSPTKFKLPSITLPQFTIKAPKGEAEDVHITGPEISLPNAELELSVEAPSADVKMPDFDKQEKSLGVDMKAKDIHIEGQGSKFKLPTFGISLPEVKGPKIDSSAAKPEIDISLPEGKMEVQPPDLELKEGTTKVKADIPEIDSKGLDVKMKRPSFSFPKFGFSKSEVKVPEADASLPEVDVKLPEGRVDLEGPKIDISVSTGDSGQKEKTKFGSPTKFKLPSITLPQFTIKAPKGEAEDVHITGPEISLPNAELELSVEAPSADVKMPDFDKQEKSLGVDMKAKDIHIEGQGSKFKLPTFGISLPEVKGPKIDSSAAKPEIDISLPEGKMEVQPPDLELKEGTTKVKADIPEIDSKGLDVKMKRPSFSFPKFGFSKSEVKVPEADASLPEVDVKLPEGRVDLEGPKIDISVSTGDSGQKEKTKFGSPTKFKLPSITLPQFTIKAPKGEAEDVHITGPEISLPNAELELSVEAPSADVKMPDFDKQEKSLSVDMKAKDIHIEGQGSKFKLPTFGISLPEVKGPKIDSSAAKPEIDISLPEGKMEVQPPDLELKEGTTKVKADIPEIDSKGLDVKMKRPSFSFPKFGFSKSEVKVPEADASLPEVDVKLPEGSVDLEGPKIDISVSTGDSGQKEKTKFGSPTKFKLPSITLPQFTTKAPKGEVEDVHITGPEISLPNAGLELSAEAPSADVKMPDFDKQEKSLSVDMKANDIQIEGLESKFKLPKFGISLPEVKGPKIDSSAAKPEIDINLPEGKMEMQPPDLELKEGTTKVKADIPEIDSEGLDVKMKRPSFSFPKFGFSKSEVKVPEADASLPEVDVKLPEGSVDLEGPKIDISASVSDSGKKEKTKFGSPTKFKLPSITLPKFAAKAPKGEVEDVHITGKEISLPNAELELSVEAPSADVKMSDFDKQEKSLSVDMKAKDIQIKGQESKFKLPTFGISLPEVKGPKIDLSAAKPEIDINLPEGKMEVQPPDLELKEGTTKVKADIPEIDSEGLDVKMKRPGFSFPKFGFSKSEVKVPEADASLPEVDVKLPEGSVDLEGPKIDISASVSDSGKKEKTKFGSPTKFKLPSITLPKFAAKAPKGEVEDVHITGKEISLPNAELELSVEAPSADVKMSDFDKQEKSLSVDMKAKDIQIKGQESKFKLPKFGISLPEVKGPKIDLSAAKPEIDINLPEGKMEVQPPDLELKEGTTKVKADIPEIDSEGLDVKMKRPGFSFPKFGFSKSEVKVPEADASLPEVDVKLPEGRVDLEGPKIDISVSTGDSGQKEKTKFGSPTKFKLPSITLPQFTTKAPKGEVEDVHITGPEISLPNAELELSAEALSADVKMPDFDKQEKSLSVDMKAKDIHIEGQGSKFKLPTFGISLPEVKGPKIDSSAAKPEVDISLPEGKIEVQPPDLELKEGTTKVKADIPEIDSKGLDVKMKRPSFSFPKFGFSKSEVKVPEADASLPEVDVKLPEGSVDLEGPKIDISASVSDSGKKEKTKFGSPTKFKLPSITLPKFAAKAPKGEVEDVHITGPEISLPNAELELSVEAPSADVKMPDFDKQEKSLSVDMKAKDIQIEGQGSKFKLPKFGVSLPEVKGPKIDLRAAKTEIDISLPEGKMEVQPLDVELKEATSKVKADIPDSNFEISVPERSINLERMHTDITTAAIDTRQQDETKFGSPTKFKFPSISFPKFGASKGAVDITAVDRQVKGPEIHLPDADLKLSAGPVSADIKGSDKKKTSVCTDTMVQGIQTEGQGSKFKLPKFGISLPEVKGPKIDSSASRTEIDIFLPEKKLEVHSPDIEVTKEAINIKADIAERDSKDVRGKPIKLHDLQTEVEIKDTVQGPPETAVKMEGEKGSPSRFKLPTIKMSKISMSKTKSQDGDNDTDMSVNVPEVVLEPKHKKAQGHEKSSKFTMPMLGDVLRGFDVEFNVPTLDETSSPVKLEYEIEVKDQASSEAIAKYKEGGAQDVTMLKLKFPKLGINLPSDEGDKKADSKASPENNEQQTVAQTDEKPVAEDKEMKPDKSGWFRFPKFSSPTKTAKAAEIESSQPPQKIEESPVIDSKEKEPEQSSSREVEEDSVSPTLSLRSSDAFADVSSALTTEHICSSLASPTKVKVKYSESTATVEFSDLHGDVITSTARTELISMEPHQPEKVNIPCSSEISSSSVDTLRQMSGEIHIVSNVQTVPDTQHAAIFTNVDTKDVETLPLQRVAVQSASLLPVDNTRVQHEQHTLVKKLVVTEVFEDGKEEVSVTQRTQVFEGDSAESITGDTASSIRKLRDTVHTEKMRFFESTESNKQMLLSVEKSLRHIDSSAEENEGK